MRQRVSVHVCLRKCTACAHVDFSPVYPIMQQRVVSVSQRITCTQQQEPYCVVYESYARTPLVICLQMAISNYHSQLVCLLALSPSTIGDQIAACGLLVIRSGSVFQDIFFLFRKLRNIF